MDNTKNRINYHKLSAYLPDQQFDESYALITVSGKEPINVHLIRLPFVFEDNVEATKQKLAKVILRIFD